jgi:hypothetical protein
VNKELEMHHPTVTRTIAGLTLGLSALTPSIASADEEPVPTITSTEVSPTSLTLGVSKPKSLQLKAVTTPFGGPTKVVAAVDDLYHGPSATLTANEEGDHYNWVETLSVQPQQLDNDMAGQVDTLFEARVFGDDDPTGTIVSSATDQTLHLYRAARLRVNAQEHPRKGQRITITGRLSRANWDTGQYAAYRNRPVLLSFRARGSSEVTYVKGVTSGADGRLRTTVRAKKDGTFSWYFKGNARTGSARAAGDFVNVR